MFAFIVCRVSLIIYITALNILKQLISNICCWLTVFNCLMYHSAFSMLSGAVKRNGQFSGVTQCEVERALGRWFTGSRDREGGRKRRQAAPPAK